MWRLTLAAAVLLGPIAAPTMVSTQQSGLGQLNPGIPTIVHVVSYIEVAPGSESGAATLLKQYRDAARQEPGNQRVDVLQQTGRPSHFIVLESWENKSAFDAHTPRPNTAVFVVTHADTIPAQGANAADPGTMLRQLAEASRREDGNLRFDVWQSDRRNHFTVVEAWRNQRALDAHTGAANTRQLRPREFTIYNCEL